MRRREALGLGLSAVGAAVMPAPAAGATATETRARVAVVKAADQSDAARRDALRRAVALFGGDGPGRGHVVLKPNFNSADPFPGSTHPETLATLVEWIGERGASRVTVADRSGMGVTRDVVQAKGVDAQARRLGFQAVALDDLPERDWVPHRLAGSHWQRGVLFPRLLEEADGIVQTCCLKTHRFGGHFTLSLKNSVGVVAKHDPDGYNYMTELHSSRDQRRMIAEINLLYRPRLVVLDAMEAFVDGGPEAGKQARPAAIIVGTDRVAVDAVGVAMLRMLGTTRVVSTGKIFEQEQIARAAALGVGVARADLVDLITDDQAGRDLLARLTPVLLKG
jgi:uncharacterized protein (DUF362 family)